MPAGGGDPVAARGAPQAPDPLEELAGWHGTPLLLRRLGLYIAGAAFECAALAAAAAVSFGWLHEGAPEDPSRPEIFRWQLAPPLTASAARLGLSLTLYVGYRRFRGTTTPGTISRRGRLQRMSLWAHSSTVLLFFSCCLMLWHAIVLMMLIRYTPSGGERWFVWCFFAFTILSTVMHCCFCLDVVINDREPHGRDSVSTIQRFRRLENIYGMYRTGEIHIRRHQEVVPAAAQGGTATSCAVCMEDFGRSDWLSELACGHCYHPACLNRWLCEKQECPLRCEIAAPGQRGKAAARAGSEDPDFSAVRTEAAAEPASSAVPV